MGQPLEVHIRKLQEFYWSEADPDGRGFVPLADALRKAGNFQESRRILREGLRRHPDFLSGHVVSAWLSLDEGKLDQAETHYQDALELDPRNVAVLRGLSELHLSRGDEESAMPFLEALIQEDPIDLDLPERLQEIRDRLAAEAGADEGDRSSSGPVPWGNPLRAAGELNWHRATLQPDRSPSREEGDGEDDVAGEGSAPEPSPEAADQAGDVDVTLDPPVLIVEDGEPIPEAEDLEDSLVTPTLGEIYLRQGLLGRAEGVFRSLLQEDPENEYLKKRLDEVQELLDLPGPVREVQSGPEMGVPERSEVPVAEIPDPADEDDFSDIVPIESLAPERTPPVRMETPTPDGAVSIDALAPDEFFSIDALAPDEYISIDYLAPDEVISIDALAPEEFISIDDLAPDTVRDPAPSGLTEVPGTVVSVDDLGPSDPVPIEALAPDDEDEAEPDSTVDDFERWLDNLQ